MQIDDVYGTNPISRVIYRFFSPNWSNIKPSEETQKEGRNLDTYSIC